MNILKYSALALLAFSLGSCNKDVDYDAASSQTNAQVYFSSEDPTEYELSEDQNSISIDVSRVNASGSLTVNLTYSASVGEETTDIFTVPSSVTFADGSKTAQIPVTFDFNEIKAETDYVLTVTLEGDELSLYGKTTQEVTILYAPWSEWEKMDGEGYLTLNDYWSGTYEYDVYMRKSLLDTTKVQYQVPSILGSGLFNLTINVDLSTNIVTVPIQSTDYYNSNYAEYVDVCDIYTYRSEHQASQQWSNPASYYYGWSFFDPDSGIIYMYNVYCISLGYFGMGYEYLQLPGYPDNNMYATQEGTFIDDAGREYAVISLTKGSDVASYAVELVPGELTEEEAEAKANELIADTETVLYADDREFQFQVTESGSYTLVTVSYGSDGLASGYNYFTYEFEVQTVNNYGWNPVKTTCLFTDAFLADGWELEEPLSWIVEVQEYAYEPGYYRMVKPYAQVADYYGCDVYSGIYNIEIDATDPDNVYIPMQYNCYGYVIAAAGYGTLKDNKITFPANTCGLAFYTDPNDTGEYGWYLYYAWPEECTILDLDYTGSDDTETSAATRAVAPKKAAGVKKPTLIVPYDGSRKLNKVEKFAEPNKQLKTEYVAK